MVYRWYYATILLLVFFLSCSRENGSDPDQSVLSYLSSFIWSEEVKPEVPTVDLTVRRRVRCYLLQLEKDFLANSIKRREECPWDPAIVGVFDRNGTEFLFDGSPHGKEPMWMELVQSQPRVVFDTTQDNGYDHRITVNFLGTQKNQKNRVLISPTEESEFQIDSSLLANIPPGGSVIIKTQKSPSGSKSEFLWIEVYEVQDVNAPDLIRVSVSEEKLDSI